MLSSSHVKEAIQSVEMEAGAVWEGSRSVKGRDWNCRSTFRRFPEAS